MKLRACRYIGSVATKPDNLRLPVRLQQSVWSSPWWQGSEVLAIQFIGEPKSLINELDNAKATTCNDPNEPTGTFLLSINSPDGEGVQAYRVHPNDWVITKNGWITVRDSTWFTNNFEVIT